MDNTTARILREIKGVLQGIDQSLYHLAGSIDKITTQILKENEKNDE